MMNLSHFGTDYKFLMITFPIDSSESRNEWVKIQSSTNAKREKWNRTKVALIREPTEIMMMINVHNLLNAILFRQLLDFQL